MSWQVILKFPAGRHLASSEDIERHILEVLQNAGAVATLQNYKKEIPYGKKVTFKQIKDALENVDDFGQYKYSDYDYGDKELGSDSRLHRILDNMSKAGKIHLIRSGLAYDENEYFIPAEPDWKETLQEKQSQEQQMKEKKEEDFRLAQEQKEQEKDAQRLQQITPQTSQRQSKKKIKRRKFGTVRGGRQ
tara:strand:+ start:762 stop:1331 length:570 start_codon:yes stop_codon:yes gene_type:complete